MGMAKMAQTIMAAASAWHGIKAKMANVAYGVCQRKRINVGVIGVYQHQHGIAEDIIGSQYGAIAVCSSRISVALAWRWQQATKWPLISRRRIA